MRLQLKKIVVNIALKASDWLLIKKAKNFLFNKTHSNNIKE